MTGHHRKVIARRNWGARLAVSVCLVVIALFAWAIAAGHGVQWGVIPQYIFDRTILDGVRLTLVFTVLAIALSLVGGVVLAAARTSENAILRGLAGLYIWFFRGTPLLVQIIFWFNIQLFIPRVGLLGYSLRLNDIISPFTAALLALALNEAAYMAEIVRGGFLAVDRGQAEAAAALGYMPLQSFRRILWPQALRITVPAIGNQTISMLKTTSLVSVVAAQDLLTRAQNIYARNFLIIELLMVASIWYLALTTVASFGQRLLERRLGRYADDHALRREAIPEDAVAGSGA